ncbi:MAG: hypothetical protein AAF570_03840, partial [Bacteroidota bacterium]
MNTPFLRSKILRHIAVGCLLCGVLIAIPGFSPSPTASKIGGVSVVSPARKVDDSWVDPVKQINAEWVAILPYAFSYPNSTRVVYDLDRQWWGERIEGMTAIIR